MCYKCEASYTDLEELSRWRMKTVFVNLQQKARQNIHVIENTA